MNVTQLHDMFVEACETERKMPPAMVRQKMSAWPDYVQSWDAYGYTSFEAPILKATPSQIDAYDRAIRIACEQLQDDERRLVWAVAHSAAYRRRGAQWSKLARILGLHDPRVVKARYKDVLVQLSYRML
jgi:hypothetical protein